MTTRRRGWDGSARRFCTQLVQDARRILRISQAGRHRAKHKYSSSHRYLILLLSIIIWNSYTVFLRLTRKLVFIASCVNTPRYLSIKATKRYAKDSAAKNSSFIENRAGICSRQNARTVIRIKTNPSIQFQFMVFICVMASEWYNLSA